MAVTIQIFPLQPVNRTRLDRPIAKVNIFNFTTRFDEDHVGCRRRGRWKDDRSTVGSDWFQWNWTEGKCLDVTVGKNLEDEVQTRPETFEPVHSRFISRGRRIIFHRHRVRFIVIQHSVAVQIGKDGNEG